MPENGTGKGEKNMRKTMLVLLALLITVTALYAEEPIAKTMLTLGDVDFPITFYERHFDVEYPEGITEGEIWEVAGLLKEAAPDILDGVWFVVKNSEHTVSSMYPAGGGPEDAETIAMLVEAVFGSFV